MAFTLKDIDHFLEVARSGSFSHAARTHNLSVSALVKSIRRVETAFGLELLKRNARSAHITESGLRFVEAALRLSGNYADALQLVAEMHDRDASLIRLGFSDASRAMQMSSAVADVINAHPKLRISCCIGLPQDLIVQGVRNGELDMAVASVHGPSPAGCDSVMLGYDPMLPVVRAGHPLSQEKALTLADLTPYQWTLASLFATANRALRALFEDANLPQPQVTIQADRTSEFLLDLVRRTDLVTMTPLSLWRTTSRESLSVLPLAQFRIARSVQFLARSGAAPSPFAQVLRNALIARASFLLMKDTWRD